MENMENNNIKNQEKTRIALGVASLVLGILSIVTMCFIIISIVFAVLSVTFGILSIIFEKKNKIGIAGLVIGSISIFITVILYITLGVFSADLFMIPDWYKF